MSGIVLAINLQFSNTITKDSYQANLKMLVSSAAVLFVNFQNRQTLCAITDNTVFYSLIPQYLNIIQRHSEITDLLLPECKLIFIIKMLELSVYKRSNSCTIIMQYGNAVAFAILVLDFRVKTCFIMYFVHYCSQRYIVKMQRILGQTRTLNQNMQVTIK